MAKAAKGKHRSAVTGRYVTKRHGKSSPPTTVKETDSKKSRLRK